MSFNKKFFTTGGIVASSEADAACSTDSVQAFGADSAFSSNIALYQFDGNANDTTTNYNGTASNVTYATGQFGNAAVFNGSSSKIELPNTSLGITDASNFSISYWFNTNSTTQDNQSVFWANGSNAGARFGSGINSTSQGGDTSVYFGMPINGTFTYINSGTSAFTANTWVHVVCVKSSTTGMSLYVDNVLKATNTGATGSGSATTTGKNSIGMYHTSSDSLFFNGSIDQVRIFNKALSAEDVATLYAETTSTASDTNPLSDGSGVALYSLDYDASDAGGLYDGTPTDVDFGVGGQINYGARFNGSSSRINTGLIWSGGTEITCSLWVNTAGGVNQYLLGSFNDAGGNSSNRFAFQFHSSNVLYVLTNNDSGGLGTTTNAGSITNYLNKWTHIVVTVSGTTVKVYLDGSLFHTSTGTALAAASYPFVIGAYTDNSNRQNVNGSIDQVRIFSKALSSDEVDTLYNNGDGETACVYTATANTADFPLDATAVAHYPLDNNSLDNKGTNDGTDTDIEYRFGRFGQAAVFNGSSSSIVVEDSSSNTFGFANHTGTASAWVNINSFSAENNILAKRDTGNPGNRQWMLLVDTSKNVNFFIYNTDANQQTVTSSTVLNANQWYHIAVTLTTSDVKIYINGVEDTTASSTYSTIQNDGADLQIGRRGKNSGHNYFNGAIDQVRIYDAALTSSQVTELYNEKPEVDTSNFKAVLWDGTTAENYISQVGMDLETSGGLVWIKQRSLIATHHRLFDSVRGVTQILASSNSNAQGSNSETLKSFEANGFVLGTNTAVNETGDNFVAWVWKGGGDAVSTNNNGGAQITADVSANTEAGFSIVKYTGSGTLNQTVYHGLDEAPDIVITKRTDTSEDWYIFTTAIDGSTHHYLVFDTDAKATSSINAPGTDYIYSRQSGTIINYCFHSVAGYSKIGSYSGSPSTVTITTGFKPSFVMIKRTNSIKDWIIFDTKRSGGDQMNDYLVPNTSAIEVVNSAIEINAISTGFTAASGLWTGLNADGGEYIYMAFK